MLLDLLRVTLKLIAFIALVIVVFVLYATYRTPVPKHITYGVSFNTPYVRELGLPWEEVYTALLDDLKVRHLRLAAHWTVVEAEKDTFDFSEMDTQMRMAEERGADVVLGVGRRLPRWPECHVPGWAQSLPWDAQKEELRAYIRAVVERYKDSPALLYWQVENEPFLGVYATEQCGVLDTAFLDEEIALVRSIDPSHKVLVTDSGNLGLWQGAYRRGDVFGTSVYVHLYNELTGPVRTILPPQAYVVKRTFMNLLFGTKESMLIELSVEPWMNVPIAQAPIPTQLERMSIEQFDSILTYAQHTRFTRQYLWGVEWWYWLTKHDHPEYWERARALYNESARTE
jgi:Cellulase (glycosyl hydrolase family 5)